MNCVYCEHPRSVHGPDDVCAGTHSCGCERYVHPDDLCTHCNGSGRVTTDSDFTNGMRCNACAGQGLVVA